MKTNDLKARLATLAKWPTGDHRVISVYLNTRWRDEQRERVRIFLKNELRRARDLRRGAPEDLDWLEAQAQALLDPAVAPAGAPTDPDAHPQGVAMFARRAAGLAEIVPMRVPFEDHFVVNDAPYLVPLAGAADDTPAAIVVFVDGTFARLIPVTATGAGAEVTLDGSVEGVITGPGWASLAESRYYRHVLEHREQHLAAVAAAITSWSDGDRAERIVLAGEARIVAALRTHLPERVAAKVIGAISGSRHQAAAAIVGRAAERLHVAERARDEIAIESILTEAAKGGQAVDGIDRTIDAVNKGAVLHLYLLRGFREIGRVCEACRALQRGLAGRCGYCTRETKPVPLDETLVDRVLATGGSVTVVDGHRALARHGGLVASLRYAA
jgi:peptide subunit release factor 1 (eRF1)